MAGDSANKKDALDRARTEVVLELRRWQRRLKEAAEILLDDLSEEQLKDPEEVGRACAKQALDSGFYADGNDGPPALTA